MTTVTQVYLPFSIFLADSDFFALAGLELLTGLLEEPPPLMLLVEDPCLLRAMNDEVRQMDGDHS